MRGAFWVFNAARRVVCLLYTSDAADDLIGVDLVWRRSIKKKTAHDRVGTDVCITYSTETRTSCGEC